MLKITKISFTNPFNIYIFSFLIVLIVYSLEWSDLFPKLETSLLIFFFTTFIFSSYIGNIKYVRDRDNFYTPINYYKNYRYVSLLLSFCLIMEFINAKGIPLLLILNGTDFNYLDFGIKSVHVFFMTANTYFCTYLFHCYLSKKNKTLLFFYILHISFFVLIFSRGSFLYALVSSLFVYLYKNKITYKIFVKFILGLLIILFGFGFLGNLRSGTDDYADYLLQWAEANEKFEKSQIPQPYFWSYLYIASPIANVQETINKTPNINFWENIEAFLVGETIPDFISKRLFEALEFVPKKMNQVHQALNVGTLFARPYKYIGWYGLVFIYLYLMLFVLFILNFVKRNSQYSITLLATLNTFMLFNMFDNMIWSSGMSLQLLYPIILVKIENIKFSLKT